MQRRGEAAGMQRREGGGGLREHKVDVLTCGSKHVTAPNGEDPKKESVGELGGVQGGSYRPEIPLIFGCHVEENPSLLLNKSFGPVLAAAAGFEGGYWICAMNWAATAVSNAARCRVVAVYAAAAAADIHCAAAARRNRSYLMAMAEAMALAAV